jgi:hypothetical protein
MTDLEQIKEILDRLKTMKCENIAEVVPPVNVIHRLLSKNLRNAAVLRSLLRLSKLAEKYRSWGREEEKAGT